MEPEATIEFFSGSSLDEIRKILCPKCRRKTNHTVKQSFRQKWATEWGGGIDDFLIVQCNGCETIQFCKISSSSEDMEPEFDHNGKIVGTLYPETVEQYPPTNDVYEEPLSFLSMPVEVKEAYIETHNALASNLQKLSAIGIRLTLELICLAHGVQEENLKKMIDELKKQGVISADMKALLQKVRIFGNDQAHSKKLPTPENLKSAWLALNTLIRYIYGTRDTKNYFSKQNTQF